MHALATARVGDVVARKVAQPASVSMWLRLLFVAASSWALVAVILALLTDRPDLVWPVFGAGIGIQIWRIWKEQRRIAKLERELEDPIDGS